MSTLLTATYEGNEYKIELDRDGNFFFVDYDIDYDLAMMEFGEPQTKAIIFRDKLKKSPVDCLIEYFGLDIDSMVMLAADFAEHVLYRQSQIYGEESIVYKLDVKSIFLARNWKSNDISLRDFGEHIDDSSAFAKTGHPASWALRAALRAKVQPVAEKQKLDEKTASAAQWAAECSLDLARWDDERSRFDDSLEEKEKQWQIRRFIDCISAIRSGKPWPPLSATR